MPKDPAVLLYTSDFLTGTMFMTNEQVGKYIKALCSQHQIGHLTEEELKQIVGEDENVLCKFVKDNQGKYYNKRMHVEAEKRSKFSKSRSDNRKKGYAKKMRNNKLDEITSEDHMKITRKSYENHMENENENDNRNINGNEFDLFWEKYHTITTKPKTDKVAALRYWKKLNKTEKNKAFENIEKYYECNKKYPKKARTYLDDKNFNDEFNHKTNVFDNQEDTENNKRNRIESLGGLAL